MSMFDGYTFHAGGMAPNSLGGIGGGIGQLQQLLPTSDSRPLRLRLTERKDANAERIARLQDENAIIESTLKELDEHPYVERIGDALRKLLG